MKHYILIVASLLTLFSCKEKVSEPPDERETMLYILRDMVLIESHISLLKEADRDSVKARLSEELLSTYDWNSTQLEDFKTYLSENPEVSLELHDEVRSELKKLEAEL